MALLASEAGFLEPWAYVRTWHSFGAQQDGDQVSLPPKERLRRFLQAQGIDTQKTSDAQLEQFSGQDGRYRPVYLRVGMQYFRVPVFRDGDSACGLVPEHRLFRRCAQLRPQLQRRYEQDPALLDAVARSPKSQRGRGGLVKGAELVRGRCCGNSAHCSDWSRVCRGTPVGRPCGRSALGPELGEEPWQPGPHGQFTKGELHVNCQTGEAPGLFMLIELLQRIHVRKFRLQKKMLSPGVLRRPFQLAGGTGVLWTGLTERRGARGAGGPVAPGRPAAAARLDDAAPGLHEPLRRRGFAVRRREPHEAQARKRHAQKKKARNLKQNFVLFCLLVPEPSAKADIPRRLFD